MVTLEYTIKNKLGIHARPAGFLAKFAKEHEDCVISCGRVNSSKEYDAKSVLSVMGAQFKCGDDIIFKIDSDEKISEDLVKKLRELLEKHF